MTEHRTCVYLFWNKERTTGCREILFSGETLTTSLCWNSKRGHFATTDRLATGMHSGMLLGDDFEALRVESFRVLPSATCVSIQLRSEVSPAATSHLSALPPEEAPDTSKGSTSDYYDHLIEESYYKTPRDILTEDLYQVPSNIPVPHSPATIPKRPLFIPRSPKRCQTAHESITAKHSAPSDTSPVPVAASRPPRKVWEGLDLLERIPSHYDTCSRLSTALFKQTSESGTLSPLLGEDRGPSPSPSPSNTSSRLSTALLKQTSESVTHATQPGTLSPLLRQDRGPSPSPSDTSSRLSTALLKQTSESVTRATQPGTLSPLLREDRGHSPSAPEAPISPLATHRHFMLRRPPIATALPGDASGSKECLSSLPIPTTRVSTSATSPLAASKSPPKLPHSPLNETHSISDVFEDTPGEGTGDILVPVPEGTRDPLVPVPEGTGYREECSRLLTELSHLREQLTGLAAELGREVLKRERLEGEVLGGRRECEHLRTVYEEVSKECATNLRLLDEERACSDKLRCQIMNLKTLRNQEKGPKLLKPKPILPKPTKKV